jgi:hypothetical protein
MAISRGSTSSISLGLPKFQSISDTTITAPGSIPDTPVFYYDAGNASSYSGSGSTFTDISGNSRNGSITGASFTSAGVASYFQCNGTSAQYISGTTTGVATPAISVETIVNFQDFTDGIYIVMTNSGADPEQRWSCVSGNSGASIGRINYTGYDSSNYLQSGNAMVTPALSANTWYHIVHTVNSTTSKTYVNGTLTGTITHINATYSGNAGNNATEMTFGTYNSPGAGYGGYTNFRLNMARWYNKVLSQDEVKRNFNDLKGRFNISGY